MKRAATAPEREGPALRVVAVPSSGAPSLSPGPELLSAITFPLGARDFAARYYRRKAVAFVGGGGARVAELLARHLHGGDVRALAEHTASERIHAWLKPLPAAAPIDGAALIDAPPAAIDSLKLEGAPAAMTAHAAGASLYFQAPKEAADALVPAVSEALGHAFAAYYDAGRQEHRGEVETFVSRAGHATGWHFDFQQNLTIQLTGRKRWRFKPGLPAAIRGATPHFRTTADVIEQQVKAHRASGAAEFQFWPGRAWFEDAESVELGPGDCLHFPAGTWHEVTALSDSLSINVSLASTSWAEVGAGAVRHVLTRELDWRRCVTTDTSALLQSTAVGASAPSALVSRPPPAKKQRGGGAAGAGAASLAAACPPGAAGGDATRLPPALHAHVFGMLAALRAHVGALRPEHLLPPAALISLRWGGAPRVPRWLLAADSGEGGASSDEEEEGEEEDTGCGSDGSSEDAAGAGSRVRRWLPRCLAAARSVCPSFLVLQHDSTLHVVLDSLLMPAGAAASEPPSRSGSGSSSSSSSSGGGGGGSGAASAGGGAAAVSINPLATLLCEATDARRHASVAGGGGEAGGDPHSWLRRLFQAVEAALEEEPSSGSGGSAAAAGVSGGRAPAAARQRPAARGRVGGAAAGARASSQAVQGVTRAASAAGGAAACEWHTYIAHVQACGNDELASLSRVLLHVPRVTAGTSAAAAAGAAGCGVRVMALLVTATSSGAASVPGLAEALAEAPAPLLDALRFAGVASSGAS